VNRQRHPLFAQLKPPLAEDHSEFQNNEPPRGKITQGDLATKGNQPVSVYLGAAHKPDAPAKEAFFPWLAFQTCVQATNGHCLSYFTNPKN
jgi:hypothetical protein